MELVVNKGDKDYKKLLELINNINIKLQDYELIVSVKPDVYHLFDTVFTQSDFNNMYQFSYFMSHYLKITNLAGEVKYRFKSVYTDTDFNEMTNFLSWLGTYLNDNVKTLFTSTYDSDTLDTFTNLNNWLEGIYLKINDLKQKTKELLTSEYITSDYESMTGLNTYILSLLNSSIKLPIMMGFRDSSYTDILGTDYVNKVNFQSNDTRGVYVCFAPNKYYNNHFNHLFIIKNCDSSNSSGAISNYANFIPTSSLNPFILFFGNRSVSIAGSPQFVIHIGMKKIIINLSPGIWTNQCSIVHLSFQQYNMINFDEYINKQQYTGGPNPFNFDVSDFVGSSSGSYNIWSTSNGYKSYDYASENDTLTINAGHYTNGMW